MYIQTIRGADAMSDVLVGLEALCSHPPAELVGKRIGLITNPSGIDHQLNSAVDLLARHPAFNLSALFGPEHGARGDAQAGVEVEATLDARTGLPVYSLYGATRQPSAAMLADLDALLFDIQDIGVRYATYISTLFYAQAAAAEVGCAFVVLDRPNPLGGLHCDGNLLDPTFSSFVGIHTLPLRHRLTVGELALLFAAEHGWPTPVIIPMHGWRRSLWYDQTGLPWVQPSPNLPTLDSITLYGATCLLEGTNISEGRGTTRPFEIIGAPWIEPIQMIETLRERQLPGVVFRPAYFTPTFSKYAGLRCAGIQIHIIDRDALRPMELGLHLLHTLRALYPNSFSWIEQPEKRFFVDLLVGSDQPRLALDRGATVDAIVEGWSEQRAQWMQRSAPFLLYE